HCRRLSSLVLFLSLIRPPPSSTLFPYTTLFRSETLRSWIGPPIKDSLMQIYHFDEAQANLGVEKYRERFTDIGIYENRLFGGVQELLERLKDEGYSICLATSKPTVFAQRIVEHFKIDTYFDFIGGAGLDDSRPTKGHVIQHVMEEINLSDSSRALMIGDRKYDIIGGQTCHMDTAGLLHGFGSREELQSAGATYIFDNLVELERGLSGDSLLSH